MDQKDSLKLNIRLAKATLEMMKSFCDEYATRISINDAGKILNNEISLIEKEYQQWINPE
ncbi:unnamed protein product [marine sediment metagenome]|uniref:Uncharacterized protein n=1 Tax=marine sediment metagenome TaxID=412755 RepID=X1BKG0_9ZZZZ